MYLKPAMETWTSHLPEIFQSLVSPEYFIPDTYRLGTDAYLVPSPDRQDLLFSFPVVFRMPIIEEISLPLSASAGAVQVIIEHCKHSSQKDRTLGILSGVGTGNMSRYSVNIEPCTVASSVSALASHLWRPDDENVLCSHGIQLSIRGALPYLPLSSNNIAHVQSDIGSYLAALADCINKVPVRSIQRGWETVLDQQHLRSELTRMGLVCFIGDGTRPARLFTRHRSWHRVAGPKDGVHIPFYCPAELSPVEVLLAGSNKTVSGLGIKRGEIFAITGSNAEGKSTLLNAIQAGVDDHAAGDGREVLVTVPGGLSPDATGIELKGADLRPFFGSIPPGMSGTPDSVWGQGSGSASMAVRIADGLRREAPYIVIDEDRAAQNLMVPCYMSHSNIRSLAFLLAEDRTIFRDTSFIIAGSGMELLIAQADRILRLCQHQPYALSILKYREGLYEHYKKMAGMVPKKSGERDVSK